MPPEEAGALSRYSSRAQRCDPRYCRTHAMVADLFAKSSIGFVIASAWAFNAEAWAELAELKQRVEEKPRLPKTPYGLAKL